MSSGPAPLNMDSDDDDDDDDVMASFGSREDEDTVKSPRYDILVT